MATKMATKEGGWGYMVGASAFLIHVVVCGVFYSVGVFHLNLKDQFKENQLMTALISSPLLGLTAIAGIVATYLMYGIGYRFTVILGGLLTGLGFGLSLLVKEYYQAVIGAMAIGLGFGLALKGSLASISAYFYKQHGHVVNTVSIGATVGGFVFPVGLYFIHSQWSWEGTCMAMTVAGALMVGCGAVLEPNGPPPRQHKVFLTMFDWSLLQCGSFWAILFSNVFWSLGASMLYVHFPTFMNETGTSREESIILVSGIGAANFASRVMFVVFSHTDHFDHVTVCLCTLGLTSIMTGLFKELFKTYAGKIGYVIIFGFHSGFWTTFVSNLAEDVIGKPYIGYGRGYIAISIGLGFAGGGPLGGWIRDTQGSYEIAFYTAGAALLAASIILVAANFRKCYYVPRGHGTPPPSVDASLDMRDHEPVGPVSSLLSSV